MVQKSGGKWRELEGVSRGKVAAGLMGGGAGRQAVCAQHRARLRVGETEE
jgi:hypothetical protein